MDQASLNMLLTAVSSAQSAPLVAESAPSDGDSMGNLCSRAVLTSTSSIDDCIGTEINGGGLEQSLLEDDLSHEGPRPHSDFSDVNFFANQTTQLTLSPGFGFQSYGPNPDPNILSDTLRTTHERTNNDYSPWVKLSLLSRELHFICQSMGKKHGILSDQSIGAVLEDNGTSEALQYTQDFCNLPRELIRHSKLSENRFSADLLTTLDPNLIIQVSQCYIYLLRIHILLISALLNEKAQRSSNIDSLSHVMSVQIGGFLLDNVSVKVNVLLEVIFQFVSTIEVSIGFPEEFCVREEPQTSADSILHLSPRDSRNIDICASVLHAEEGVQRSIGGGGVKRLKELMKRAKKECAQITL